jgi:hypothetical protein
MNRYKTSHPGEECLLRYADGELSSRDAASIREHLDACWRCRAEVEDIQETITDYVHCEQALWGTPPQPPKPWDGFEGRLDRLIAERQNRWQNSVIQVVRGLLTNRRISAAALAGVVMVCFAVLELKHPPSVSAAELLQKASAMEGRIAHHPRLRIKTRDRTFTRTAIVQAGHGLESEADAQLRLLFLAADYSWENPLSAVSFAAWRSRLPDRHDDVVVQGTREAAVYQVRTSTRSSSLVEATLNLRLKDLDVVSATFRFRSSEWVEIAALPGEPNSLQEQSAAEHAVRSITPTPTGPSSPEPGGPVQELRVMAALHSADADLGEQVELSRDDGGTLIVTATGIAPERRAALESSLSALPGVSLRFREPRIDLSKPAEPESGQGSPPTPKATDPLRIKLQQTLGGAASLARFTDQVLETSEAAMVHVHDLRKLAERFSPGVEQHFDGSDRTTLAQLRRDHAQAFSTKVADLHRLLRPVLLSLGAAQSAAVVEPPNPPNWQAATETLFAAAQRLDRLLTALLAGTGTERPAGVVTETDHALKQLRVDVDWYQSTMGGGEKQRY